MSGKKTIVVKIGTSSLTEKSGRLSPEPAALADGSRWRSSGTRGTRSSW